MKLIYSVLNNSPLHLAVQYSSAEIVELLLMDNEIDVNALSIFIHFFVIFQIIYLERIYKSIFLISFKIAYFNRGFSKKILFA